MNTKEYNQSLSESERQEIINKANGFETRPDWNPYCLKCSSSSRMLRTDYGWKCNNCGNEIGWNLQRINSNGK